MYLNGILLIGVICVICGYSVMGSKGCSRCALSADRMSTLRSLSPHHRVAPQQMLLYLCAGKNFCTESSDFVHRWINVVALVRGPGIASGATWKQTTVMNQS